MPTSCLLYVAKYLIKHIIAVYCDSLYLCYGIYTVTLALFVNFSDVPQITNICEIMYIMTNNLNIIENEHLLVLYDTGRTVSKSGVQLALAFTKVHALEIYKNTINA